MMPHFENWKLHEDDQGVLWYVRDEEGVTCKVDANLVLMVAEPEKFLADEWANLAAASEQDQ